MAALGGSALVPACGDSVSGPTPRIEHLPRELTVAETAVISASNRFAFDLLSQLAESEPDSNLFISPLSASMALGMTLNGTAGTTLDEMRQTLRFGSVSLNEINESYRGLLDLLTALDPVVELGIGNSIWYREGFAVQPSFLEVLQAYFDAEVTGLDFTDPGAAGVINDWVRSSTNGRIDQIVEAPIDPLTMMFLINAVYFKGDWTARFDRARTRDDLFHLRGGGTSPIRMMEKEDLLLYRVTDDLEVVDVPYGGQAFSMTILLPRPGVDLGSVVQSLDAAAWTGLVEGLGEARGTLQLPRFTLEWESLLNEALKALGMRDAFDPLAADFTPMYPQAREAQLHIRNVKQKTFLKVDEEGTEAAAATSVEVGVTSAGLRVRVDRPFLLAIRERLSGTILFVGMIQDPGQS
jgi:serpin B